MRENNNCLACENGVHPSEKVAHRILDRILKQEKLGTLVHFKPWSKEDMKGIDFLITTTEGIKMPIQVKSYFFQESKRFHFLKQLRKKAKIFKRRYRALVDSKIYILKIIDAYMKLELIKNDEELVLNFQRRLKRIDFFNRLRHAKNYREVARIFLEIRPFPFVFQELARHAKLYPDIKILFLVNVTPGIYENRRDQRLQRQWKKIILETVDKERQIQSETKTLAAPSCVSAA